MAAASIQVRLSPVVRTSPSRITQRGFHVSTASAICE
jgi:hypothetical protein